MADRLGLAAALNYALKLEVNLTWPLIKNLAHNLRCRLCEIKGVRLVDTGAEKCGIVSFHLVDVDSENIRNRLSPKGINIWVSHPESTLIDASQRRLKPLVRASLHYYNTEREVARFCAEIASGT